MKDVSLTSLTENSIAKIIGLTVDIEILNNNLTGVIFSINKEANLLLLLTKIKEEDNLTSIFINTNQISNIQLSKSQVEIAFDDLMKADLSKVYENERNNISKDNLRKKAAIEPNFEKGLNVYEALSKMYKCTYEGKRITLDELDAYIEAPFHLNNLHCEDEEVLKRLSKIVSGALKKSSH